MVRTSTTSRMCCDSSRSTNSFTGRVECPMVKNGSAIIPCDRSAVHQPERSPLVQGDVVGLVALDLVLRVVLARMVDVSLPIHVFRMHLDDPAADASGLRVPAHMIADIELFRHASTRSAASMALEVLHGTLVLLGRRPRLEGAEIAAPAGLRVHLARIEAIAARLELADHRRLPRAARLCAALAIANLLPWFGPCQPRVAGESSSCPGKAAGEL